jgi:hypothetical protein
LGIRIGVADGDVDEVKKVVVMRRGDEMKLKLERMRHGRAFSLLVFWNTKLPLLFSGNSRSIYSRGERPYDWLKVQPLSAFGSGASWLKKLISCHVYVGHVSLTATSPQLLVPRSFPTFTASTLLIHCKGLLDPRCLDHTFVIQLTISAFSEPSIRVSSNP